MYEYSPWGRVYKDETLHYSDKVSQINTASHGGVKIEKKWAEENLSIEAIEHSIPRGDYYYWEEDCRFYIPMYEILSGDHERLQRKVRENHKLTIKQCREQIKQWTPTYFGLPKNHWECL